MVIVILGTVYQGISVRLSACVPDCYCLSDVRLITAAVATVLCYYQHK